MTNKRDLYNVAKTLGIAGVTRTTSRADLETAINEKLGNAPIAEDATPGPDYARVIAQHGTEALATETGPAMAKPQDIPNLSPTGTWQGKRAKLKRTKTGHNDMEGAIFNWNGYPCIIPIDMPVDIPWPIYGIIQQCRGMNLEIRQEDDGKKVMNVKDISYFDKYPYQFMGVTPGTEHLPESPLEYVLDMYVEDFPDFTVRMWRQLCILFEINDETAEIKPGVGPEAEIIARRNTVHYLLNLPQEVDQAIRERIRDEKRGDIGMEAKAA